MSSTEKKPMDIMDVNKLPTLPEKYSTLKKVYGLMSNSSIHDKSNAMLLLDNGLILRHSDQRRVYAEGKVDMVKAIPQWREEAKIKADGVEQIKQILQQYQDVETNSISPEYSTTIFNFTKSPEATILVETKMNTPKAYALQTDLNRISTENMIFKGVPLTQEEEE